MLEISKILNFKKAISLDFDSSSKFSLPNNFGLTL